MAAGHSLHLEPEEVSLAVLLPSIPEDHLVPAPDSVANRQVLKAPVDLAPKQQASQQVGVCSQWGQAQAVERNHNTVATLQVQRPHRCPLDGTQCQVVR